MVFICCFCLTRTTNLSVWSNPHSTQLSRPQSHQMLHGEWPASSFPLLPAGLSSCSCRTELPTSYLAVIVRLSQLLGATGSSLLRTPLRAPVQHGSSRPQISASLLEWKRLYCGTVWYFAFFISISIYIFKNDLFIFLLYMHWCVACMYVWGFWIPRNWSYSVVSCHRSSGNWTWSFWKNNLWL